MSLKPTRILNSKLVGTETVTAQDYDAIMTLDQIKTELRESLSETVFDDSLTTKRLNAFLEAEIYCNVSIGETTRKAYYTQLASNELLPYGKAQTIVSVSIDGEIQTDLSGYTLFNGRLSVPHDYLEGNIIIEYTSNINATYPIDTFKEAIYNLIASNFDQEISKEPSYRSLKNYQLKGLIY